MLKKMSWNALKSNIKLISAVVIILMVLQVLTVYVVTTGRKTEYYNSKASEALLACVVSMNEMFDYMTEVAISSIAEQSINHIMLSDTVTQDDIAAFCRTARSIQLSRFMKVKNFYVYNDQTQMVYTSWLEKQPLGELPASVTKSILSGDSQAEEKIAYFVDDADFIHVSGVESSEQALRFRIFPNRQSGSCLLLDASLSELGNSFDEYCQEYASEIFIVGNGQSVFYSTNSALQEDLERNVVNLAKENFSNPVFRRLNGERYLVLKHQSTVSELAVYSLIHESNIQVDYQETKTLLITNISLFIAICIILGVLMVLRVMNESLKENRRHQLLAEQEKQHNQFMRSKQHIANCLFRPSEQDIRIAKEYIEMLLDEKEGEQNEYRAGVAVLRFEIYQFDNFHEKHSSKDVLLYKYGIVNICEEVLNQHVKALSVYERDAEIVFVIIPGQNNSQVCKDAYEACRKAVYDYIGESISAYLSMTGMVEELPKLNQQTIQLAAYKFLFEDPMFLESAFLARRAKSSKKDMMERLERVCAVPERTTAMREMEALFDWLKDFNIEDAKNALWILMFRLYNTGKKNAKHVESVESLVSKFKQIPDFTAMKKFFEELCGVVYPDGAESQGEDKNDMVQKVLSIIERRFCEPGFCSDHVAEEMRLSKAYLSRKFRQSADNSISEAINERRMEEFVRYLVTTNKSIKSIIESIGSTNPNYFMIMFKKKFQMTPSEYRQAFSQQKE